MDIAKSKESEHEMKDAIDRAQDLLQRLKNKKEKRFINEGSSGSDHLMNNENTGKTEDKLVTSFRQRTNVTSGISVSLKPAGSKEELSDVEVSSPKETENHVKDEGAREGPKKRKQDKFLSEIHERAEVISKSARKSADKVVSSMPSASLEDDPEAGEFLKKIRAAPTEEPDGELTPTTLTEPTKCDDDDIEDDQDKKVTRSQSAPDMDFFDMPMEVNTLNLSAAKAKMSVGRAGSLKGRRKPTAAARRSLKLSAEDTIVEGSAAEASTDMEEKGATKESLSKEGIGLVPSESMREGLRPRVKPKPKPKSKTVSGIVLPGLADAIQARQRKQDQVSSADLVREAAERRRTQVEKEEKTEKQPEKPTWLVEAEARRKMHDRRRQPPVDKPKMSGSSETSKVTVISKSETPQPRSPTTSEKPSASVTHVASVSPTHVGVNVFPSQNQSARRRVLPYSVEIENDKVEQKTSKVHTETFSTSRAPNNTEGQKSNSALPKPTISAQKPNVRRTRASPTSTRRSDAAQIKITSPNFSTPGQKLNAETTDTRPDTKKIITPAAISSIALRKSGGEVVSKGSEKPASSAGRTIPPHRATAPPIKPKPTRVDRSQKATVTSKEVDESSAERRGSVELRRTSNGYIRARPVSMVERSSTSDERFRSRADTAGYRPIRTGEILPQWKLDLMERRKSVSSRIDLDSESPGAASSSPTAIPQWKKDLAERRKQREQAGTPSANKENQPKKKQDSPPEVQWRRETLERKNRRASGTPARPQSEIIETAVPEWRQKLSSMRRGVHVVPKKSDSPDVTVPSFMREFQLKKRCAVQKDQPIPSKSTASYV